ncbi:MAG: hypothetical protein ABIJ37_03085 [Pseudomonadota bacterium]
MKFRSREILFREAILSLFGAKTEGGDKRCTQKEREICKAQFGEYFDWACENCEKNGQR